jgi:glycosyltransferase involved in cell wall biosynthesis
MSVVKVLDLRDTHEIGGPGKTILETFRAIDSRQFELHLGVFLRRDESDDTPFISAARKIGLPVHTLRGYNQYDPRMILQVAQLVRKLGIDVVHAHEVKSDVITVLAAKLRRVATMTTLHGWIANDARQRMWRTIDCRLLPFFDCVLVVSEQIRQELLANGVPGRNLRLLHNAIVIERYQRTGQRGYLTNLVGRSLTRPVIVSIGRLSPEKGHADLVEALAITAQRGYRISAVLAGDGSDRSRLQDQIRSLGLEDSIHLPGYIDQPERVLEDADLAVLPSHTEGLPNAALEAMVMQVPLLATAVGGTPEVVTDGETGRLVKPRSPRELADGIIDFLMNPSPWTQMASRAREAVERQFNFTTRTRTLETIYAELAGGRR